MVSKDILQSEHIINVRHVTRTRTRTKTRKLKDEIAFGTLRIYKNETIILQAML